MLLANAIKNATPPIAIQDLIIRFDAPQPDELHIGVQTHQLCQHKGTTQSILGAIVMSITQPGSTGSPLALANLHETGFQ